MVSRIRQLSVANVDAEAIDFASEWVTIINDMASLMRDLSSLLAKIDALHEYGNSFGAMLESGLLTLLGKPLRKYDDFHRANDEFERQRQQLHGRLVLLERKGNLLDGKEMRLRASLSEKYNCVFPPLGD